MATNGGGAGAGDDDASAASPPLHIVMFPWLAFGHLIPFLELAKLLAARGHAAVTFLSTPRNLSRLGAAAVPPELSASLRFVSLSLPVVEGLPEGAESTADVPPEKVELLKKAFGGLAAPFAAFLAAAGDEDAGGFGRKPDWIVIDFAHNWVGSAHEAHRRVEPEEFMSPPPWIPFPSSLAFRRHEADWFAASYRPNAAGFSDADRVWQVQERSDVIVYRSCPEIEGRDICGLLESLHDKPAVPSGLLLPPPEFAGGNNDGDSADLIQWLDEQPERSVIYVALGTEAPLTSSDVHELALGLELAGTRFLWALRGGCDAGERRLPEGYEHRVAGRGHGLIARAMADRGLGVEVERKDDGSFGRDAVAAAVRRVMSAEEDGKVFARNAREMKEKLGDGVRQERYVDELAALLRRHRRSSS
uniref:Glycosyltransferase subfamily 4-like N-terminal domain-containing protein n=1 Tax=Leersia perrieri TaxID=77586 RepID=A0A0D9WWL9_9ORYZ